MAWKDTLLDASFRGVTFDVQGTGRSGARSIDAAEYPYAPGAELGDMGQRGRRFKLKAIIWGDDYEDRLAALWAALETPGVGELVHPIYGPLQVMAEAWDDSHEADLVDGVVVNLEFIEHTPREPVFTADSAQAKADAVSTTGAEARAAADDALVRQVSEAQGGSERRLAVLKDTFTQGKAALSKLLDTTSLRAVLSDLDPVLYPRAYVADLEGVIDRALQGLPFGGRNLYFDASSGTPSQSGSGQSDFNTASKQLDPAAVNLEANAPAPDAGMLADTAAVQAHARVYAATAVADCAVIVLAGELERPLLDRADIEGISNRTRQAVQVALDAARASLDAEGRGPLSTALGGLAYAVQEVALAVINQRPPLVRRASPIGGPVRLVAHQIYGDASRAPEISRLNRLGRHVYIERGDELNVYSA